MSSNPVARIVELIGAPSGIDVHFDTGLDGIRGSYVMANIGTPSYVFSAENPNVIEGPNGEYGVDYPGTNEPYFPQPFDWYINLNAQDVDYKVIYQLTQNGTWEQIFKLIPNSHDTNKDLSFANGSASTTIDVSVISMPIIQKFGTDQLLDPIDIPQDSTEVSSEEDMLSLVIPVKSYAWRSDLSQFYKLMMQPATDINSWRPDLRINAQVDIEPIWLPEWHPDYEAFNPETQPPYPFASSFIFGKPYTTGTGIAKEYHFPITINAAYLDVSLAQWLPLEDVRKVHLSINVI